MIVLQRLLVRRSIRYISIIDGNCSSGDIAYVFANWRQDIFSHFLQYLFIFISPTGRNIKRKKNLTK